MNRIPLSRGLFAIVDDEDFESLNKFKWCAYKDRNTFYAVRSIEKRVDGQIVRRQIKMHRLIMGVDGTPAPLVDHIDHDGLNNRKSNLRLVTNRENLQNRSRPKTSKYAGVCKTKESSWQSGITSDGKWNYVGRFKVEEDAARAYDDALAERGLQRVNFP